MAWHGTYTQPVLGEEEGEAEVIENQRDAYSARLEPVDSS